MPYDARAIANLTLDLADFHNLSVSTLALQKILYFEHGWWLAKKSGPLIAQAFEAWDFGPVVRIVYDSFKDTPKAEGIRTRAFQFDYVLNKQVVAKPNITDSDLAFLEEIVQFYAKRKASELVTMTHWIDDPWDMVRNNKVNSPGNIIDNEIIKSHFLSITGE
jgi:uncharacterized phage-associated protein